MNNTSNLLVQVTSKSSNMRLALLQLACLLGIEALSIGHSSPKRHLAALDINDELYEPDDLVIGRQIGQGTDATVYAVQIKNRDTGEVEPTEFAYKKDYPLAGGLNNEFEIFKAIDGKGIAPSFRASVYDLDDASLPKIGIIIELIKTTETKKDDKEHARGAAQALKNLHDLGVVHEDHALGNVLVDDGSTGGAIPRKILLIDFAKARKTDRQEEKDEDLKQLKALFDGVKWKDGYEVED